MDTPTDPGAHPRRLLADASVHYGEIPVARWCADLLLRRVAIDDAGEPSLEWIGGGHARMLLSGQISREANEYWPRVWAARGLLYAWDPSAIAAICHGLADPAWRVREMSAKVVRHREVGEAADLLPALSDDPVVRVRVAAMRALGAVGEAEAAEALHSGMGDVHPDVREAAETALEELSRRLDRSL